MDREQAKDLIKGQLEVYLERKGIDTTRNFNCLNPSHLDKSSSMNLDRTMGQPFHTKCLGCNAYYSTFDLIEIDYGLNDLTEIFNKACELFDIQIDQNTLNNAEQESKTLTTGFKQSSWTSRLGSKTIPRETRPNSEVQDIQYKKPENSLTNYITKAHEQVGQTDFFQKRGISRSTIEQFKLGYDPNFKTKEGTEFVTWQAIIIPNGEYSYTAMNTDLSAEKHNRIRRKGPSMIYNLAALRSGSPVFIVQNEMDTLSLAETGAKALALGNPANTSQLIESITKNPPVGGFVLTLENDEGSNDFIREIGTALRTFNIPFIQANLSGDYKDPNEALTLAREQFVHAVQATLDSLYEPLQAQQRLEREAYLMTNNAKHLHAFFLKEIKDNVNTPYIPTGFEKLDLLLDGGLNEGLYILAAISASGKTSFAMQIADQIAQAGNDILIFSLDISRNELIAKSISRLTFLGSDSTSRAKTSRDITTAKRYQHYTQEELDLIKASMEQYGQYASRIYINEGTGNTGVDQVRELVTRHINITGNKPIIIIDYLQVLASQNYSTDNEKLDRIVMELKRISRDYKIPVLVISSSNPCNNNVPIKIENFKENEIIVSSSDVMIVLHTKGAYQNDFDINQARKVEPREIELQLIKNRNGSNGKLYYNYYPMFNCFVEAKD